jgi:5-methylcytosine-specific restriction endonuclease McrBC GTP-binding regulatory subunit McrB
MVKNRKQNVQKTQKKPQKGLRNSIILKKQKIPKKIPKKIKKFQINNYPKLIQNSPKHSKIFPTIPK